MYQVIIVEDDPMVAEIDKQYVEHNNKMTIAGVFQNGQDALEFARNNPVDLIMLDYYMPVMDGHVSCEAAGRGDPGRCHHGHGGQRGPSRQ